MLFWQRGMFGSSIPVVSHGPTFSLTMHLQAWERVSIWSLLDSCFPRMRSVGFMVFFEEKSWFPYQEVFFAKTSGAVILCSC